MAHEDCLFCKIINGEIPSKKVYEDEFTFAFDDISPMMPVHTLVVPKVHYDNLADDVPEEVLGHVFKTAAKVAEIKGVAKSGYRIVSNIGPDAQQSVLHLHVHVLGGEPMNAGNPRA